MIDGQYTAIFFEADPTRGVYGDKMASGVIEFRDGAVFGGDSGYHYSGSYVMSENRFDMTVDVVPHQSQPLHGSSFGVRGCTLDISGNINAAGVAAGGKIRSQGKPFHIRLTRIVR